jgi:hypothetical protein
MRTGSEYGPVPDSCEHSNEPLGLQKTEFIVVLSDHQLLKQDIAP